MNVVDLGNNWKLNWDGDSLELLVGTDLVAWINMSTDDLNVSWPNYPIDMVHIEALLHEYKMNSRRHA